VEIMNSQERNNTNTFDPVMDGVCMSNG
jgi:hypothetical protein